MTLIALYVLALPVFVGTVDRLMHVVVQTPFDDWVNIRYMNNPFLTALHLLPGFLMLLIAPLQFFRALRTRYWRLHKILGWIFCAAGLVSGIGVLWMVIVFPALGGLLTQVVTFGLVTAMVVCTVIAINAVRHRHVDNHRAFMARAYAIALSVSTARIFIEIAERVWDLKFEDTFVLASGAGVAVNCLFVECILRISQSASGLKHQKE